MNGLQPRVHTVLYMVSANASQAARRAICTVINYSQVHIVQKAQLHYKIRQRKNKQYEDNQKGSDVKIYKVQQNAKMQRNCYLIFNSFSITHATVDFYMTCLLEAGTNVTV